MSKSSYNFVIFDTDGEYYSVALYDLADKKNVKIKKNCMESKKRYVNLLYRLHTNGRLNSLIRLPFQSFWNKYIYTDEFEEKKPICFIFSARYSFFSNVGYCEYLRSNFQSCKIVMHFRDTIKHAQITYPGFDINYFKRSCDLILSANTQDVKKYNLTYFTSFGSIVPVKKAPNVPISDVVFIGAAKDRLEKILRAFEIFSDNGLKCDFYLTGVPLKMQRYSNYITYANKPIPYSEMLFRTVNSSCIFEATQKCSTGFTSRYFEALFYNKKLISDNQMIKTTKFYNEDFIQLYKEPDDIDVSFIRKSTSVNYGYKNEYSPERMLDLIENHLSNK